MSVELRQLVSNGARLKTKPSRFPKLGFCPHCPEVGAVNRDLKWKTWDQRYALLAAVIAASMNSHSDQEQQHQLMSLFGEYARPLFGTEWICTVSNEYGKRWIVKGWPVVNRHNAKLEVGKHFFTITSIDAATHHGIVHDLKTDLNIPFVDFAEFNS